MGEYAAAVAVLTVFSAENGLVEIVDESGNDVAPGGRGRVVLTGLYN